jgi:hypothetical protein
MPHSTNWATPSCPLCNLTIFYIAHSGSLCGRRRTRTHNTFQYYCFSRAAPHPAGCLPVMIPREESNLQTPQSKCGDFANSSTGEFMVFQYVNERLFYFELSTGIEPMTSSLQVKRSTIWAKKAFYFKVRNKKPGSCEPGLNNCLSQFNYSIPGLLCGRGCLISILLNAKPHTDLSIVLYDCRGQFDMCNVVFIEYTYIC